MLKRLFGALVAVLTLVSCGGTEGQGASVSSVAVQQGDLPGGMVRCDLTGDIDSFIKAESSPDPATSKTMSTEWTSAKSKGAKAGYAAIYTDSSSHCAGIKTSGSDIGAATYKVVINFVVEYKDEKSASDGYKSESILGFSPTSLRSGGAPVVEGANTGLTSNSIALTQPFDKQFFYIAVWQNKTFVVILAVLNLDAASAKKVATSENGRIK